MGGHLDPEIKSADHIENLTDCFEDCFFHMQTSKFSGTALEPGGACEFFLRLSHHVVRNCELSDTEYRAIYAILHEETKITHSGWNKWLPEGPLKKKFKQAEQTLSEHDNYPNYAQLHERLKPDATVKGMKMFVLKHGVLHEYCRREGGGSEKISTLI